MADITMCRNDECVSACDCHRFCAIPSANQSYAVFTVPSGEFACDDFLQKRHGDRCDLMQAKVNRMGLVVHEGDE